MRATTAEVIQSLAEEWPVAELPEGTGVDVVERFAAFVEEHPVPDTFHEDERWNVGAVSRRLLRAIAALLISEAEVRRATQVAWAGARELARYLLVFPSGHDADSLRLAHATLMLAGAADPDKSREAYYWRLVGSSRFISSMRGLPLHSKIGHVFRAAALLAQEREHSLLPGAFEAALDERTLFPQKPPIHPFALSEEEYFEMLDLDREELSTVRERWAEGSLDAGRRAYLDYRAAFAEAAGASELAPLSERELREAEEICENILVLRAHMERRHDFGTEIDWTTLLDNDVESNVYLNAMPFVRTLWRGFRETGEAQYLEHAGRMVRAWWETSPVPDRQRPYLQWRTLEAGNRAAQQWPEPFLEFSRDEQFRESVAWPMARSYLDHARYLLAHIRPYPHNWHQVENTGLAAAAILFPEWKDSDLFLEVALRRLRWCNQEQFLPDGFQAECSTSYHLFPLAGHLAVAELARRVGRPLPDYFLDNLERWVEAPVLMLQPNSTLPVVNDGSPREIDPAPLVQRALFLFDRQGFRYAATHGAEGKPPEQVSFSFPHAGYYIMRDRWAPEGQYLLFDAGYYGASHQHEDKLSFVLWAEGRPLIFDPGTYQYVRDERRLYFTSSRGHNTLLVDGRGQARRFLYEREHLPSRHLEIEPRPDPDSLFVSERTFDYARGWYRLGYARDEARLDGGSPEPWLRDVHHNRSILYVKGEYWVLVDHITGSGTHRIEQVFHLAPIIGGPSPDEIKPGTVEILEGGGVRSANDGVGDIAILPASDVNWKVRDECGQRDPFRGWSALYGEVPSHDITFELEAELPLTLGVVLWPVGLGSSALPQVSTAPLEVRGGGRAISLEVRKSEVRDRFLFAAREAAVTSGEIAFRGEALWIREREGLDRVQIAGVGGEALYFRGSEVAGFRGGEESFELLMPR